MVATPRVTVIVPAWNVEQYLEQCLSSVVEQSIGVDSLELLVVDDGSTDGTPAIADAFAAEHPQVRVWHGPNSGGPGRPRNIGLDQARGEFVLFLDADDFLGPEAIARLVSMADRAGSDVVLAKMAGADGRPVPHRAFARTRERAAVRDVYSSLSVLKLFRRSLIERLGLRFTEGLAGGEDAPFTMRAYFAADTISVVGDYDCYYARLRRGSQTTKGWKWSEQRLFDHQDRMAGRIALLRELCPDPELRDALTLRHLDDLLRPYKLQWVELDEHARRVTFAHSAELLTNLLTPELMARLKPWQALRAYCLTHDRRAELEHIAATRTRHATRDPIVLDGRVYGRWPHFRDGSGIPDRLFDVTEHMTPVLDLSELRCTDGVLHLSGTAYVKLLGGFTTLVLTHWSTGERHELATEVVPTPGLRDKQTAYPAAGFRLDQPLATAIHGEPLGPGPWELALVIGKKGVLHTRAITSGPAVRTSPGGELYRARSGTLRLRHGARTLRTRLLEGLEPTWQRVRPGSSG